MKVFIIDDEVWVAKVIENLIDWESEGFGEVSIFYDSVDAYSAMKEERPELVLTDIRMPETDGLTLIKQARQDGLKSRFVIVSGYNDFKYAKEALEFGALGYLLKPVDRDELLKILRKVRDTIQEDRLAEENVNKLNVDYKKSVAKLRERFFVDYFKNSPEITLSAEDINREYLLHFVPGIYRVAVLTIDDMTVPFEPKDWGQLCDNVFGTLAGGSILQMCHEMVTIVFRRQFICIMNYDGKSRRDVRGSLAAAYDRLSKESGGKYRITLALGTEHTDIEELKSSYVYAERLLKTRVVLGTGCVYDEESRIDFGCGPEQPVLPEYESALVSAIKHEDSPAGARAVSGMIDRLLEESSQNPLCVVGGAERIIDIMRTLAQGEGSAHVPDDSYFRERKLQIEECSSAEHIKELLCASIADISAGGAVHKSKNRKIVEMVKRYIDENYASDINLNDMAERVSLSAGYLSELFSKEQGCTFKEYIIKTRMEMAKKLLHSIHYSVAEIAEKVGYADVKHFSKIFKKYTGVSPARFRRLFV